MGLIVLLYMFVIGKGMIGLSYDAFGARANIISLSYSVFGITIDIIACRINNPDKLPFISQEPIKIYHPCKLYYFILSLPDNKK